MVFKVQGEWSMSNLLKPKPSHYDKLKLKFLSQGKERKGRYKAFTFSSIAKLEGTTDLSETLTSCFVKYNQYVSLLRFRKITTDLNIGRLHRFKICPLGAGEIVHQGRCLPCMRPTWVWSPYGSPYRSLSTASLKCRARVSPSTVSCGPKTWKKNF